MSRKPDTFKPLPDFVVNGVRYFCWAICRLLWRIEFRNLEHIPKENGTGLLIAANHQTYLDPCWICLPVFRQLRFMAWDKAMDLFLIGPAIRRLGAFPVTLDRKGAIGSTKEALRILRSGQTLIVFPEGSREFEDGELLPFKQGAARIASQAGVPILPVTIKGGNKIWPRGWSFPRTGKLLIIYHPLLNGSEESKSSGGRDGASELTEKLKRRIASEL